MAKATHIAYGAHIYGYQVLVLDQNETLDEYNGGNIPEDGTARLNPHIESTLPAEKLLKHAKQTALEMAAEHGVPESRVHHDTDIDRTIWEEDGFHARQAVGMDHLWQSTAEVLTKRP